MFRKNIQTNIIFVLVIAMVVLYPIKSFAQDQNTPLSKFALSVNPIGILQFGPIVSAEIGLSNHLVLNMHIRFPSLGLLSYVAADHDDGLDEYSGIAFGGGLIFFLGNNMSKPYIGGLIDYQTHESLYAKDEDWEWSRTNNVLVFAFNGGYRFRFSGGFFINTGVFLGFANDNYEWEYTDTSEGSWGSFDSSSRDGSEIKLFLMLEVTLGVEF